MARTPLSKRTRFEVFKRDRFTCQYCGRKPPQVVLHCDHVHPVSDGGSNEIDNLVTSCADCNLGKSDKPLNAIRPVPDKERMNEMRETRDQLEAYQTFLAEERARLEDDMIAIQSLFIEATRHELNARQQTSVMNFIKRIGYWEVREAAEIALSKSIATSSLWPYFCGICNNKARAAEDPEIAERQHAANIIRQRLRDSASVELSRESADAMMGRAIKLFNSPQAAMTELLQFVDAMSEQIRDNPGAIHEFLDLVASRGEVN